MLKTSQTWGPTSTPIDQQWGDQTKWSTKKPRAIPPYRAATCPRWPRLEKGRCACAWWLRRLVGLMWWLWRSDPRSRMGSLGGNTPWWMVFEGLHWRNMPNLGEDDHVLFLEFLFFLEIERSNIWIGVGRVWKAYFREGGVEANKSVGQFS